MLLQGIRRGLFAIAMAITMVSRAQAQRHVIIDTDVGPDDLMAIAFLLANPSVRVDAIVTETGLTRARVGADNVLRLLHLAHAGSIPVFVGSPVPLQPTRPFPQAWIDASEQLGRTAAPPASRRPRASGAVDFLTRRITRDSSVELLLLGPLTNIALAIRRAGRNHVLPLRTVMMGGAINVPGNLTAREMQTENTKAEWNVYSDPVAAAEVFGSALRIEMIGLDATRQVRIDAVFVRQFRAGPVTPMRAYVSRVLDAAHEWIASGAYYAWDPLAAVALLDPDVVRLSSMPLTVDVSGRFPGWTHRATAGHAVAVAVSADRARFMRDFAAGVVLLRP